jgi:hypothetical protein
MCCVCCNKVDKRLFVIELKAKDRAHRASGNGNIENVMRCGGDMEVT